MLKLFNWLKWPKKTAQRVMSPLINPWHRRIGAPKNFQESDLIRRNTHFVFICAGINSKVFASVPLRLYVGRRKGQTLRVKNRPVAAEQADWVHETARKSLNISYKQIVEVEEHPFIRLIRAPINLPHFVMPGGYLLEIMNWSQDVTGNFYILIERDGTRLGKDSRGMPKTLWPLRSDLMKVIPSLQDVVSHYQYGDGHNVKKIDLPAPDILHCKYPSISNMLYGDAPVAAQLKSVDLFSKMLEYEESVADNQGRPDVLLRPMNDNRPLTEDQMKLVKEEWLAEFSNGNQGGVAVANLAEPVPINWKPRELAYLEGRSITKLEICNALDVPISKLETENVNKANAEAGERQHRADAIAPRCRRNAEWFTMFVQREYDEQLFVAFDNPVPEDVERRNSQIETHLKWGMTTHNEERMRDDMEPAPDGQGDQRIIPINMKPIQLIEEEHKKNMELLDLQIEAQRRGITQGTQGGGNDAKGGRNTGSGA